MTFYSTIRLRVASAALKKSVLAYRAQWHEFLVGQGFNRPGDEGCLPDLPGKEYKPMIPRGLTWAQHRAVWKRAIKRYKQGWVENFRDTPLGRLSQPAAKPTADVVEEMGASARDILGKYYKPQTKEGIREAVGEVKDALFGKETTPKDNIKSVKEKAEGMMALFKETSKAFVEGYREAIDLHDQPPTPPTSAADSSSSSSSSSSTAATTQQDQHLHSTGTPVVSTETLTAAPTPASASTTAAAASTSAGGGGGGGGGGGSSSSIPAETRAIEKVP